MVIQVTLEMLGIPEILASTWTESETKISEEEP